MSLKITEMIRTPDGDIPMHCLGSIETREQLECGVGISTEYIYQGKVVRKDYQIIVSDDALVDSMKSLAAL